MTNPMPVFKRRLGASICLTVFSIVSIIMLLPSSQVSTRLQKITLGGSIDDVAALWEWGTDEGDEEEKDGIRLVVFGDSWVDDTVENGKDGKGKTWVEVLCEVINCTSRLNFAASQPSDAWPAHPPTGAMTSNRIHASTISRTPTALLEEDDLSLLPDLATQIQTFISVPLPKQTPKDTIFVVSFGFWDIYDYAGLDYALSQNVTDASVNELFAQLDILYDHFVKNLSHLSIPDSSLPPSNTTSKPSPFRIIIPKLMDPTLLPGWISQRPVPLPPSTVAEQQKNAVYLTDRWNRLMANQMAQWVKDTPSPQTPSTPEPTKAVIQNTTEKDAAPTETPIVVEKDIFYYDLPNYLLNIIVEHQLEDEGITDASGLGTGESPFGSIYQPCVGEVEVTLTDQMVDFNGMSVCKEPEEYLFWNAFELGSVAMDEIGREVGTLVMEGKTLRRSWEGTNIGASVGTGHRVS